jgi:hypothetical protein
MTGAASPIPVEQWSQLGGLKLAGEMVLTTQPALDNLRENRHFLGRAFVSATDG